MEKIFSESKLNLLHRDDQLSKNYESKTMSDKKNVFRLTKMNKFPGNKLKNKLIESNLKKNSQLKFKSNIKISNDNKFENKKNSEIKSEIYIEVKNKAILYSLLLINYLIFIV